MLELENNMSGIKKYFGYYTAPIMISIFILVLAYAFYLFVSNWNAWDNISNKKQISIAGEGKVYARPDMATFIASVITKAKKVKEAQLENTKLSNQIIEYLAQNGIKDKDVKTTHYSINPQYESCVQYPCPPQPYPQSPRTITAYEVHHSLKVIVRDLEKIDDLLDGVVTNGANEINSINFEIDNEEALKAEARKKAINNAKERAEVLAKELGIRLKEILFFSESGSYPPVYSRYLKSYDSEATDSSAAPQVQAGEQEIISNVTIAYEFE